MKQWLMAILAMFTVLIGCSDPNSDRNRFRQLFSTDFSGENLHFYSVEYPNEVKNYPFSGNELPFDLYYLFGAELAATWSDLGYGVYAVGRFEKNYILRIPGRYTADQLALYRWEEDGFLYFLATLSSKWCDEGWCNLQDAWLKDLNGDGRADLVTHYAQLDDGGVPYDSELVIKLQSQDGIFQAAPDWPLSPADFPLFKPDNQ